MENENEIKSLVESVLRDQEALRTEQESKSSDEAKMARMEKGMADAQEQIKSLQLAAQRSEVSDDVEEAKSGTEYDAEFKSWLASGDATEVKAAELNSSVDEAAGYLVPQAVISRIIEIREKQVAMRRLAGSATVTGNTYKYLFETLEGAAAYTGEGLERVNTATGELGKQEVGLVSIYANPASTVEQFLDSDAEAWLVRSTGKAVAKLESHGMIAGDGTGGAFKGILEYVGSSAAHNVIEGIASTGATPDLDDLLALIYGLDYYDQTGAKLLMSNETLSKFRGLKDNQGRYLVDVNAQADGRGIVTTLFNHSVELDAAMPSFASGNTPIIAGNFADACKVIDKNEVRVIRDMITRKGWVQLYSEHRSQLVVENAHALRALTVA